MKKWAIINKETLEIEEVDVVESGSSNYWVSSNGIVFTVNSTTQLFDTQEDALKSLIQENELMISDLADEIEQIRDQRRECYRKIDLLNDRLAN